MTQAREAATQPISLWRSWGSACAIFTSVVLLALVATCGIAWFWGGGSRFLASALVAWGLCWFAALIALVVVFVGRQLGQGVSSVLLAMGVRMGLPLVIAIWLSDQSPQWGQTHLMTFLLGNYFVALIVETCLAIHVLKNSTVPPLGLTNAANRPGELAPKA